MAKESFTQSLPSNLADKAQAALAIGTAIKLAREESAPIERINFFGPDSEGGLAAAAILSGQSDVLLKLTKDLDEKNSEIEERTGQESTFVLMTALVGDTDIDNAEGQFSNFLHATHHSTINIRQIAVRQKELLKKRVAEETLTVRMSPVISEGMFNESQREYAPYGKSPLMFRDMTEMVDGDMRSEIVKQLQRRVGIIEGTVSELKTGEEESLADAYDRLCRAADEKEDQASFIRYLAVGDPGKVNYENVANFSTADMVIAKKRAIEWERKFPGIPNIYMEEVLLFQAGFWPKGFRVVDGQERYVIDIPMRISHEPDIRDEGKAVVNGCWASGDTEIFKMHALEDDCSFGYNFEAAKNRKIDPVDGYVWLAEPDPQVFDLSEEKK